MKYKVGDKVKIRSDLYIGGNYSMEDGSKPINFVRNMEKFKGTVQEIAGIDCERYILKNDSHLWTDEMIEGKADEKPNWKLVIIPDGDTTKGLYYENGKVTKTVEVKRYFKDEYDANAAIKAISEKLSGEKKTSGITVDEPKFKTGDFVEVTDRFMSCPTGLRGHIIRRQGDFWLVDFHVVYGFTHDGFDDVRLPEWTGYFIDEECLRKLW